MHATFIIGLILTSYPNCTPFALDLYSKIGEENASNMLPLIKQAFEKEIKNDDFNYKNIISFLDKAPSISKTDVSYIYSIINKSILKFKNSYYNRERLEFLIKLINSITPVRDQYQFIYSPRSSEIDFTQSLVPKKALKSGSGSTTAQSDLMLEPAPQILVQSSGSRFWTKFYEVHREFLSSLILNREFVFEKLDFLREYHELVPFKIRTRYFRQYLSDLEIRNHHITRLNVSRKNLLNDSLNQLIDKRPRDLIGKFNITFDDEAGVDAGGLTKEWFTYIIKELFDPETGLFIKCSNNCYHPNPLSYTKPNHIQYFKLAGEILALALIENKYVNSHLSMAFYRQILHQKIKLKDLGDFDEPLLKSLQQILSIDDVKDLDLVFAIDDNQFGHYTSIELMNNGENIEVTNENRMEYVSLYANYRLRKSVINQITAFCEAFDEIIPPEVIRIFSPSELDLLICGIPTIDLDDMKNYTLFYSPYHANHPVIVMFFNMLAKWSQENLAKFLLFLTGSSQVPINGFKDFLIRRNPIAIAPGGESDRLPVAHTCFNTLDLPYYNNEEEMNEKLMMAIQECEFGIA